VFCFVGVERDCIDLPRESVGNVGQRGYSNRVFSLGVSG
jgi:hypothetical protein